MTTSNSEIVFNIASPATEFVKGVLLIIAFLALMIPFAVKFYAYF
ncbi:MAG: hypothetical protein ACKVOU_05735 [Cytophagales bacterium]